METKIPDNSNSAHPRKGVERWPIVDGIVSAPKRLAPGRWLSYGFTAREAGDFMTGEAHQRLLRLLGEDGGSQVEQPAALRLLRQVHGTRLLSPAEAAESYDASFSGSLPEGDGWVGTFPAGMVMGVRTADCLPLLLWCDESRAFAVVHAGWRGAVAGICAEALRELNCAPDNVRALIGPCIRPCCFEVGHEVAEAFGQDERWLSPSPENIPGKYHLDLPRYVAEELVSGGMRRDAIGVAPYCTCCDGRFFSHRGGDSERLCNFGARR